VTRYLLDTNHLGEAIQSTSRVRDRIGRMRRHGDVFGIVIPVLCETMAGVVRSRHAADRRRRLRQVLRAVRLWPLEIDIAERYGGVFHELRDAGRAMSQVDMMLAAVSRVMSATILTSDRDFEALPDISAENWLAE
jgi:predicted nucleic acid-binding protein